MPWIMPPKKPAGSCARSATWYLSRRFLAKSTMGKAVSYALAKWGSLEVYLKEPGIEIDTNLVENAIRPTALGRKNWLFFGDAECRRTQHDPSTRSSKAVAVTRSNPAVTYTMS